MSAANKSRASSDENGTAIPARRRECLRRLDRYIKSLYIAGMTVTEGARSACRALEVFTAADLPAALRIVGAETDRFEREIDPSEQGEYRFLKLPKLGPFLERVVGSRFNDRLLQPSDGVYIDELLAKTKLMLARSAWKPEPLLVSEGWRKGLHPDIAGYRPTYDDYGYQTSKAIDDDTLEDIVAEALVWWVATDAEVRRCPNCGSWFQPKLRDRSRFDCADCRKAFGNRAASPDARVSSFTCKLCSRVANLQQFSGLSAYTTGEPEDDEWTVSMTSYRTSALLCVSCVQERFKDWARYLLPILGERS